MIRDNIIYFGYGTVDVYSNAVTGILKLTEIKPPQEIGESIFGKDDVEYLESIEFKFDLNKFSNLAKDLINLKTNPNGNKQIEFMGYILDFNNYNEKSVNVVSKSINRIIYWVMMPLAC